MPPFVVLASVGMFLSELTLISLPNVEFLVDVWFPFESTDDDVGEEVAEEEEEEEDVVLLLLSVKVWLFAIVCPLDNTSLSSVFFFR